MIPAVLANAGRGMGLTGGVCFIVRMDDVHNRTAGHPSFGNRVDMNRKAEAGDLVIVLHKSDLFHEDGGGFHQRTLRPGKRAVLRVEVDAAFEQSGAFLDRPYRVGVKARPSETSIPL